jgi:hypothetical protein
MTVLVVLMRMSPSFELVFSGREGRLVPTGTSDSELASAFFAEQGVEMSRVRAESRSRTTRENAARVAGSVRLRHDKVVQPQTNINVVPEVHDPWAHA